MKTLFEKLVLGIGIAIVGVLALPVVCLIVLSTLAEPSTKTTPNDEKEL